MRLFICLVMAILLASVVFSIPDQFTIQGQLKNADGVAQQGTYNFTFYIYDAHTGGNVLFQQSSNLTTDSNGIYTAILKNINLNFSAAYYLATKIEADNEMVPRLNMTSSGYAMRANVTDSLNSGGTYYATTYYQGTNKVLDSSGFNGENITGGTVADARIASTIARDSETIAANTSMKNYVDPLFALRLTNHSDASIPQINSSGITVNGYPVCSYAGFNAENLTGGTLADARTSSTLYTYLGGFKADNFTALFTSNYANTGAYNDGNFTTSLSNSGVRTSITNNITTHATTKHGNTTQEMISTINTTGYYQIKTNWSNILNMPAGFSDGTDDTGVGGSASLPGDGIYIYNDTAYRFNETKANSTTDLRITSALSNAGLYNDANTTSVRASITNNITAHEGTFKHGNTSQEMIKAVNTSGYFQHKILAANILLSTWLQNHSDASIPIINASAITIAGIPVATYAGISGENITGGTVADARTSSTLYTYLGGWKLTNFTTAYASTGYWQQANFTTANSGAWKAANNSLDLKNHSDASIPNINVSSITVAGIPVATYAGFAGENITSGIVADARIAATLARDSEVDTVNATQKTYIDTNDALRLMNHSDASIRIVNASSVTIAGVPVATYAGISAGNLTSGTIDDIRISTTITRDTELTSYITNLTDTNFTKTCWGPVCTWYNYTMGALVTQVT